MNQPTEPKKPIDWANAISWVTGLMIFLITSGSFVMSYSTLYQTAVDYGIANRLAWIWPLLVDFPLVVFSLAVVRARLYDERTWWPWLLVALYTAATVAFNILHAPANLTAQIVAVVAPLSLFLSFETLMAMLKSEVVRRGVSLSLAAMKQELERIGVQIGLAKDELDQVNGELQQAGSELSAARQELNWVNQEMSQKAQEVSDLESKAGELMAQVERLMAQRDELKREAQTLRAEPKEVSQPAKVSPGNSEELTDRQRQILDLLGRGNLTQDAMAGELGISVSTLKRELARLNGLAEGVR